MTGWRSGLAAAAVGHRSELAAGYEYRVARDVWRLVGDGEIGRSRTGDGRDFGRDLRRDPLRTAKNVTGVHVAESTATNGAEGRALRSATGSTRRAGVEQGRGCGLCGRTHRLRERR